MRRLAATRYTPGMELPSPLRKLFGRKPKEQHRPAGRGLRQFERKFGADRVRGLVDAAVAARPDARIFEIGCGEGRLMLDLLKQWPTLRLAGINKAPWDEMQGSESLALTAERTGLFTPEEFARLPLPEVHFGDASKLPAEDDSCDLVFSQTTIQYVHRKDHVLEEAWRILRPGGTALLNIDTRVAEPPPVIDFETPRFVLSRDGEHLPLARFFEEQRAKGVGLDLEIELWRGSKRAHVVMEKTRSEPLALGLTFDEEKSVMLKTLRPGPKKRRDAWWGFQSRYDA